MPAAVKEFKVNLESGGRDRYLLDDKPMTGVTTVLNVLNKPALPQWAANQGAEASRREIGKLFGRYKTKKIEKIKLLEIIDNARFAHRETVRKAADTGTDVHKEVENWIKSGARNLDYHHSDESVEKMVRNFMKWSVENQVTFLASEQSVYSEKHFYAGTFDFICEIDGRKYIGDFKTSNDIYYQYFLQMAAYKLAWEELGNEELEGAVVVRCGKKGDFDVKYRYAGKEDKEAWLAALKIYRANNNYEIKKPWKK